MRESGETLLVGQSVPRDWLKPGQKCGLERTATYFGPTSVLYAAEPNQISAHLDGPTRNPPKEIRLRFRTPEERPLKSVRVNSKSWKKVQGDWVLLPGRIGSAQITGTY